MLKKPLVACAPLIALICFSTLAQAQPQAETDEASLRFSYAFPAGFTYDFCRANDPLGVTVPIDRAGKFYKPCAPDTLYSWQDEAKVAVWLKESSPGNSLPIPYLYLWRTPMGTFAYGKVGVRVKLRKNAHFVRLDRPIHYDPNCDQLASVFGRNAPNVYIKVHDYEGAPKSISEYLICSTAPVESWSVGQPLFLEEMEREIEWIRTHVTGQYDLYIPLQGPVPWINTTIDAGTFADPWTVATLLDRLRDTCTRTPEIRFSYDSVQTLEDHFSTNNPVYFNPGMPRPARPVIVTTSVAVSVETPVADAEKKNIARHRPHPRHRKPPLHDAPLFSSVRFPSFDLDTLSEPFRDFFHRLFQHLFQRPEKSPERPEESSEPSHD